MEGRAYDLVGRVFDLGSLDEVSEILYDVLKLPVPQAGMLVTFTMHCYYSKNKITEVRNVKRARKAHSTKSEILCKLADRHEMPTIIMEWRKLRHLNSNYIDILDLHSFYDSRFNMHRIYSTILQTSAPTGRLAMNCMFYYIGYKN